MNPSGSSNYMLLSTNHVNNSLDSQRYCKMSINNDDEDNYNVNHAASFQRKSRSNPCSIIESSESDQDDAMISRQRCSKIDITSLLRTLMINTTQRSGGGAGAGAGAGCSQLTINRNSRTIPDYSDSCTDIDEGVIKHFGHSHSLNMYNFQHYSQTYCNVCSLQLVGSGYGCESCQFHLHASCFDLPQKIQHNAHPAHPLTLRYPSYYKHCGKTCDACCEHIKQSFLYCCDLCHFDLHVTCATLYNVVKGPNKSNGKLRLYHTFPFGDNIIARCNVCNKKVSKEGWMYYSKDTGHIAHINCAKGNIRPSWVKESLNMLKIK